ncbi:hypothetical protein AKJ40_03050 [candidate division MSBL1 archaeon SCGC-AAA259M10]|uniref:ABC-2 type transporter domain-containing protein n=1 Tax=candidate division MSBL1 archaeon SCGC-AAA259M10 TaxID=1698270 RepID=A0A133UZ69_9EURY|nr:hypothetical protein AKJ40_03050 [candidate division MSBL1 archaeon SCGC-AAA259M10]
MNEVDKEDYPETWGQISAIFKYEILWNLRKKKVLAMFIIAIGLTSLDLFLPAIWGEGGPDPKFLIGNLGPRSFIMILLAVTVAMSSISGEFEKNTIIPLASKPVSRKIIYFGKLLAMLTVLLIIYIVLDAYLLIGGRILYGPQSGMNITVIALPFLTTLSTAVWIGVTLLIGSATKSSTIAAIGTLGLLFALGIIGGLVPVLTSASGQPLNYLPGSGESGQVSGDFIQGPTPENLSINTGTDSLSRNFLLYSNDPTAKVTIRKQQLSFENIENTPGTTPIVTVGTRTEPLSQVLTRSVLVALAYLVAFNLLSLTLFKRSEVTEG